ncbi:MAG: leucine-rich repeat protein [Luteolibacter sp.]|uniref:leucine-rich repeat protein n=1 Tax=Luteolibacter sp. TaxID=1962973 RepID=UPI003263B0CC
MIFSNIPGCALAVAYLMTQPLLADGTFGNFTYTEDGTSVTITGYPDDIVGPVSIPSSIAGKPVTAIGVEAFMECHKVTAVTIPDSVTRIDDRAFYYCGLTSISLPESLASIGEYSFYRCTHLPAVSIPDSVTSIGSSAFNRCIILDEVSLPSGLTEIPDGMFYLCSRLTNLVITPNITHIGNGAFGNCVGLKDLTIPGTVKIIGGGAFVRCDQLEKLVISDGVEEIKSGAFGDCPLLTKVTIPASVTKIENYAFRRRKPAVISATFLGNAPAIGAGIFKIRHEPSPPATIIYYTEGAAGFTSPVWNGYRSVALAAGPEIGIQQPAGSNLDEDDKRSFGTVKVGESGGTKTFTIVSTGTEDLTGLAITIDGANAGDFIIKPPNKASMATGESRIFTVTFKPKGQGTRMAHIHVTSTETTGNPFSIMLAGMGVK